MNVLVTGGAGYIGAVLVPELLELGHSVTVLDNFAHRQNSLAAVAGDDRFTIVHGDAREPRIVAPLVAKADAIIPLAALVGAPACDRDQLAAHSVNYSAINLIDTIASPAQRIIFPATNSGYGTTEGNTVCTEETPLNPLSYYAKLKGEAEALVLQRGNSVSLRLATVFGASPRMRTDLLLNDLVYRAVKEGSVVLFEPEARRNFVHVRDVAGAIAWALEDGEMTGVFNVGLDEANMTKGSMCYRIRQFVPGFVWYTDPGTHDPDKRDYLISTAKLRGQGWQPLVGLDRGIKELINLYAMITDRRFSNVA